MMKKLKNVKVTLYLRSLRVGSKIHNYIEN
jgi:hypothetical protein